MKRTPWFPQTTRPVHRGLYETKLDLGVMLRFWTGVMWVHTDARPTYFGAPGLNHLGRWRGLAEKP